MHYVPIRVHRVLFSIAMFAVLGSACQSTKTHNILASDHSSNVSLCYSLTNQEYLIGPEDVLEINVWKNTDLSKTVIVRPDGMITLPLVGEFRVWGRTPSKVREMISERLKEYKNIPEVTVTVVQVNSYYIFVLGEVRNPGKYQVKSYTSVLQVVALAGGFSEWANKNDMLILRKNLNGPDQKIKVRYKDILGLENSKPDELLHPGDTLIIR